VARQLHCIAMTAAATDSAPEEEGAMPNGYEVMTEFSPETEQFEDEASAMAGRGRSGRWIRAGRNIIVVNA
jgi:hypothetical protein